MKLNPDQMNASKLKNFFKAKSYLQLFIIFLVFAITGSLTLIVSDFIVLFFDIRKETFGNFFYYVFRIILIFPVYQFLLIVIGTIFGEFKYFWEFEKKFLRKLGIKI